MGSKVLPFALLLSVVAAGCVQSKLKSSDSAGRLGYMAKKSQSANQKQDFAKIDREITRMRLKELAQVDAPEARPLPKKVDEDSLYAEALKYYYKGDVRGLRFFQTKLAKQYPHSVHLDNVLLLVGKLHRKQARRAQALRYFQEIIQEYPLSNKRPAALLEKGIVYGELNLKPQALQAFSQLEKEYPGSPESAQVGVEKKLITLK